jgi:hypothetical protein
MLLANSNASLCDGLSFLPSAEYHLDRYAYDTAKQTTKEEQD